MAKDTLKAAPAAADVSTKEPMPAAAPTAPAPEPQLPVPEPEPTTGTDVMVVDFGADAGAGLQNVSSDEYAIPFINVIQSNSPQLDRTNAKYNAAAKSAMLMKSSTGELLEAYGPDGHSITFIPVHRDHHYVEYTPRDAGGGFVGIRPVDDPLVLSLKAEQGKFGSLKTSQGTELTEMFNLYGLFIVGDDYIFRAILGFKSTQIKKYQAFMEIITGIKYPNGQGGFTVPPMWAHRWQLSTVPEKNKKGSFIGVKLILANEATVQNPRPALIKLNDPLYKLGKEFYTAIESGKVKVDREGDAAGGADPDEEIPF